MDRQAFRLLVEDRPSRRSKDRRSFRDRRRSFSRAYFLNGGRERRSWKERRYVWHMTR